MIAAGLGCRRGCEAASIVQALTRALAGAGKSLTELGALYAPAFKREEAGLQLAAAELGKPLVFLSLEALRAQSAFALTRSAHVEETFGLPSVAETAALAGAVSFGARAHLLGPRYVFGGAACALAALELQEVVT